MTRAERVPGAPLRARLSPGRGAHGISELGMPTNKLWIEHTERAAWDSVEALRERLSKAEERLQALMPNVERVPQLLDSLQRAKEKYGSDLQAHDEVVAELLDRLERLQAQLDDATKPEPTVVNFGAPAPRARLDSEDLDDRPDSARYDEQPDIGGFVQAMHRRHEASGAALPRDVNRLLALAETKLDDLTELEGGALREAAVDLAILAARVHAASRGRDPGS